MQHRIGLTLLVVIAFPALGMAQRHRTSLPIPDPEFKGNIGKTFEDSTPDFPKG